MRTVHASVTRTAQRPAMGSSAHFVVVGGVESLLVDAIARLEQLESRWSRFDAGSEVSRHNAAIVSGMTPPVVSSDTRLLFARAAEGHRISRGLFDPYQLAAVTAAGYRTSFDPGRHGPARLEPGAPQSGFDPGGLGKGLAADIISAEVMAGGADGVLVSIGGDLRVRGSAPGGRAWRIDVEDPRGGPPIDTVALTDGAVATSSRVRRRWLDADGAERHHLIDPLTGIPARTQALSATVLAAEGWQAEVLTKVAFLGSRCGTRSADGVSVDAGLELIEAVGAAALVVTPNLAEPTSRWAEFRWTDLRAAGTVDSAAVADHSRRHGQRRGALP